MRLKWIFCLVEFHKKKSMMDEKLGKLQIKIYHWLQTNLETSNQPWCLLLICWRCCDKMQILTWKLMNKKKSRLCALESEHFNVWIVGLSRSFFLLHEFSIFLINLLVFFWEILKWSYDRILKSVNLTLDIIESKKISLFVMEEI